MTLNDFVNEMVRQISRYSDEQLLGAAVFVTIDGRHFEIKSVKIKTEPESGMTVAMVDVGGERA